MIKCSKCGFENEDSSNFCRSCGASLEKEKAKFAEENQQYLCPKCGERFIGKQKFCSKCGLKFNWPTGNIDEIPVKVSNKSVSKFTGKSTCSNKNSIINIILHSMTLLSMALIMIAVWLNASKYGASSISSALGGTEAELFGLGFLFKNMWQLEGTMRIVPVFIFIMFIIAVGMCFGFGIPTVIKSIKGIIKKDEFKSAPFAAASIVPVLAYFVAFYSLYNVQERVVNLVSPGPGYVMALISLIILITTVFAGKLLNFLLNKNGNLASVIISTCLTVFGLVTLLSMGLPSVKTEYVQVSSFYAIMEILARFDHVFSTTQIFTFCVLIYEFFSFIFVSISLCFTLSSQKTKNLVGCIVYNSISIMLLMLTLVFGILLNIEFGIDMGVSYKIGAGLIVPFVFSIISLGVSIPNLIIAKKK